MQDLAWQKFCVEQSGSLNHKIDYNTDYEYPEHVENVKINRCKNEPPGKWIWSKFLRHWQGTRKNIEEFEDTKGAIRIRISKKNKQHNGQISGL